MEHVSLDASYFGQPWASVASVAPASWAAKAPISCDGNRGGIRPSNKKSLFVLPEYDMSAM